LAVLEPVERRQPTARRSPWRSRPRLFKISRSIRSVWFSPRKRASSSRSSLESPPGRSPASAAACFTGRLAFDKGADVLVEAVGRMASAPVVLVLGAGVLEPALRSRIAEAGLADVVRLCGWVADPPPWVAAASVQACPSRDEAFSQAAVLAMGSACLSWARASTASPRRWRLAAG
jgi:glycosyltransferase involved in cell wall biosynthesis